MANQADNLDPAEATRSVLAWLAYFRRVVRRRLALDGAARLLAVAVGVALFTLVLDRLFRLSLPARLTLVGLSVVSLVALAWAWVVRPLRMALDPLTIAAALDRNGTGELTARVGSVLQLPELLRRPAPPSAAMVRRAVQRCHEALAAVNLRPRLNDRRRNLALAAAGLAVLVPATLAVATPATAGLWAKRMLLGRNDPWPQRTYLDVVGLGVGRTIVVPRGEPFVLKVVPRSGSQSPPAVWLRYREAGGGRVDGGFTAYGPGDFRYDFASIDAPVSVDVWGGDDTVEPFTIRPAERPRVTDLQLVAQHPRDAKPTTYTFGGDSADLSFLPRTKLELRVTASVPVASSKLTGTAAEVVRTDDTHLSIRWTQSTAASFHLELTGRDAGLVSVPTDVSVGLKRDQPPRVTIAFSGVRPRVTPSAHIPLTVDARDDYHVTKVVLTTKSETPDPADAAKLLPATTRASLFEGTPGEAEAQAAPGIDVASLGMKPGGLITVSVAATDDCYVGPQTTASRQLVFRVVPPEELFREILLRQQSERARFRRQVDEANAIAEVLTRQPATADAAAALAHRHRAVQRDVGRTLTALSDALTEMRLNRLGTPEAYELMQRNVIGPLRELNDGLLNQQKDRLDTLRPGDAAGLTDAHDRQGQIVERMREALKQMSQWDSFVDVLNQLNEVIRLQGQAQQTTSQLKKRDTDSVFEK